jgi:hypothetical protein
MKDNRHTKGTNDTTAAISALKKEKTKPQPDSFSKRFYTSS